MARTLIVSGIYANNISGCDTTYLIGDSFVFAVHYAPAVQTDVFESKFIHYPLH